MDFRSYNLRQLQTLMKIVDSKTQIGEECLEEPKRPQYGGGIIVNPEFKDGLKGWSVFGYDGKLEKRSERGNNFIIAHSRSKQHHSISQRVEMHKEKMYTLSAWIKVNEGNASVVAAVKTKSGFTHAGAVVAQSGCWSMLKGGLTVESSGPAEIYFEARKTKVKIQAVDAHGRTIRGVNVTISIKKASFPFGTAINKEILNNPAYQNWFATRFSVTTFEDEMKWYSTENTQGHEDYSVADSMLAFAQKNGIAVRGHNIFWDDPNYQQAWVKSLSPDQLRAATMKRINSIVPRYAGKLIAWDVVNENLHFSFFEDKLGKGFSAEMYQKAHALDPKPLVFMNEFSTLESSGDVKSSPANYVNKLKEIKSAGGNIPQIGIGLESHFSKPNIPYVRASLDTLAATGMPIWITELDVKQDPNQILKELHSHPAIKGIVMWASWHPQGCYRMCLTDNNFKNLPTGDVVDKLINGWQHTRLTGMTDSNGLFEAQLFHGDYDCQRDPEPPQYRGGIIVNPEFDEGRKGWEVFGQGTVEVRESNGRNRFIVTSSRSKPSDSFSQKVYLEENKLYTFSAWVQISDGSETVDAIFKTPNGHLIKAGTSKNPEVEIWVDNVSLQPFTKEQWTSHQMESIKKVIRPDIRHLSASKLAA
ncbi:hypothetical protein Syun_005225 [Stephania yunnanensis]|uniref:GH10 domain-containing protein n=1 Tax=Stephania yunnanensis TaxID=152371 RepID=A0AAP0L4E4_9MAGN